MPILFNIVLEILAGVIRHEKKNEREEVKSSLFVDDMVFYVENSDSTNTPQIYYFFLFYWCIVDLQCCVNFYCTEKWPSYTYTHSFSYSFPLWFIIGYWTSCTVYRTLLFIHPIYISLHRLIPNSQSFPPHLPPQKYY